MGHIALIGCGHWGKNLVRNFFELGALHAICEVDSTKLASLRDRFPGVSLTSAFSKILEDKTITGVAIATPASSHYALAKEALLAGKDVFVEKPLALDVSEGRELVELADRKRRILMVGHLLWYHPAVLRLKEFIDAGELGRIQYIYSNRLNIGKIRREENILWSFAPHDISVILALLGEMPDAVQAQGGNYLHEQIADVTVSLLSFPSGVKAHLFVSWLHPFKEQKLIVVGDRKMAVFDDIKKVDKLVLYPHSIAWRNHVPVASKAEGQRVPFEEEEPLRVECLHFLECIAKRSRPRTDGEEGLRVLRVLQQCQEALEVGTRRTSSVSSRPTRTYFAHESAFIDDGVEIGEGTTIWHVSHILKGSRIGKNSKIGQNVVIGPNVTIGDGVKIQNNVSVYEGVTLEDNVFCGPSMAFTNVMNPRSEVPRMGELKPTWIRRGASLGANCTILCGVTVGRYAFVGASAVVTRDVPDYALVVGNPGRIGGWMCRCGIKLNFPQADGGEVEYAQCQSCGMRYQKQGKAVREERLMGEPVR